MMTNIAPKAQGQRKIIAPAAPAKITKDGFMQAFKATPVLSASWTQGPLAMWELSRELKARRSSTDM